jgi:hypothetical protein
MGVDVIVEQPVWDQHVTNKTPLIIIKDIRINVSKSHSIKGPWGHIYKKFRKIDLKNNLFTYYIDHKNIYGLFSVKDRPIDLYYNAHIFI